VARLSEEVGKAYLSLSNELAACSAFAIGQILLRQQELLGVLGTSFSNFAFSFSYTGV